MVSVIIPVFNRQNTIVASVKSVLNQSFGDLECIVVDDCSTDLTSEMLRSIKDDRLSCYRLTENKGACYARNYGIDKALGDVIAFNDSDDVWHPDKLMRQIQFLTNGNYDVCFCCCRSVYGKNITIFPNKINNQKDVKLDNLLIKNYASTQTIIAKKECFYNCRFDEKLSRYQDWDLMIQLSLLFLIGFQKEVLVDVGRENDNISLNPLKGYESCKYLLRKYKKLYDNNPKAQSSLITYMGTHKYQLGEKKEAEKLFIDAIGKDKMNYLAIIKLFLSKIGVLHYKYRSAKVSK